MTLSGTLERRIVELEAALERAQRYVAQIGAENLRARARIKALEDRVERKDIRIAAMRQERRTDDAKRGRA